MEEKTKQTVRYSKKREAILSLMQSTDCHPTAEWLFQQLKPAYPDLSLGTIYRNLTLFQTQGQIKSVGVVKGQERFDAAMHPHSHFVCQGCGKVVDLELSPLKEASLGFIEEKYGFSVERQEITLFGRCNLCRAEEKPENH